MNHDVPVQSLIDHIKTAVDVDPWAKEMAEELLKKQEPKEIKWIDHLYRFNDTRFECGSCHRTSWKNTTFCPWCGLKMTGTEIDKDFSEGAEK